MSDTESILQERMPLLVGLWSGVGGFIVIALVGYLVFENLVFGLVVGGIFGLGSFLFNPWFFEIGQAGNGTNEDLSFSDWFQITDRDPERGMFGLGLELAGILIIAGAIVAEPPAPIAALAIGVAAGLTTFIIGRVIKNRVAA